VRELGRRAARALRGSAARRSVAEPSILVAVDLGPADVAELREEEVPVIAIALAQGAATSHAAIMARSLGLPMVVGAGDALLADATAIVVDGNEGRAYLDPTPGRERWAAAEMARQSERRRGFARSRALPPVTRDGRWVTLLANAATPTEIRDALAAEADGIGLLRTELAFLDAHAWPTQEQHERALAPLLALLPDRVATVRVLDFGEDKTPPFLHGTAQRGLALLLEQPEHLEAQLRAIVASAADVNLRILLPLVESGEQVGAVRALLQHIGAAPALGAMIETPGAAEHAHEIAHEADFLSIGTNDLVQYTLGLDRSQPLATAASAADPRVLRLIAATAAAAHDAGLTVEICGESASLPELAALYVGLGVDELSVAPARLDELRAVVRDIRAGDAAATAEQALAAASSEAALALGRRLVSGELGNEQRELLGGRDGVLA
jgi:phosphoenolpyruvate-protein kinase (PTS system EI component)